MKRIKKGDEVIVIAGRSENKGKRGKVVAVKDDTVIIEGINQVSKHVRPNPQLGIEGGIVKKEAGIHISNVMLFNAETGKRDRVGFKIEDGVKFRYYKSTGKRID
ncbi:50S ribosomal protein L24 [Dichelobacter nodosus]|uniref:Large ribosomal subunit protein uL24 n=1 Tax=Dichelobacter nodosus (strain VCS1703A) TaxID=246195 RepID=RL24_DICNV|nr:50S ribosomal protein L24 [Dichelobacter nodosus]A5EX88.1 RecName: Full=Large ribosomal subunit protein uL24; AltName: Full=50S ribosomal protein L24 [Dichelobacter nodosus VCS1703A]ABQ13588.1 50S ribosomal protein L24 [Dichelobacter nodosus VCS1703A]AXM46023.1 50S ribosomal protein L24 [Dichelobacter nodosus]KNZ39470.1 50S ribosomal protein L24 [Dichelobacter nodosus]TGA65301.1 50S ribosomal protein L24 [Dichelobacter nodosus]